MVGAGSGILRGGTNYGYVQYLFILNGQTRGKPHRKYI